jgi:predicted metal-dependent peptidase
VNAHRDFSAALAYLIAPRADTNGNPAHDSRPYLAHGLSAITPVQAPGLGTMAVDEFFRVYYDPGVFARWTIPQAAKVIEHEFWHPTRSHHLRARASKADPEIWGLCADAEINDGMTGLPDNGGITPASLGLPRGLIVEQYYDLVSQGRATSRDRGASQASAEASGRPGESQGGQSSCPSGGSQSAPPRAGASSGGASSGTSPGGSSGPPSDPMCRGGSGVDGVRRPWEQGAPAEGQPGISADDAPLIRRQVAQEIRRYVASHGVGSVPGNMRKWADDLLAPPKVLWTRELASVVRGALVRAGTDDYTYSRPSRRQGACPDVVLPCMRARRPDVCVVLDTSGSMGKAETSAALSEVQGVCRAAGSEVTVLSVDAAVAGKQRVTRAQAVQVLGGGGTNMGCGLDAAAKSRRPKFDVIVVLTDGQTPWPKINPAPWARIIVVLIHAPEAYRRSVPGWARTLEAA